MPDFRIIGTSLESTDQRRVPRHRRARPARVRPPSGRAPRIARRSLKRITYVEQAAGAGGLARAVAEAEAALGGKPRRLYHLSVPPAAAADGRSAARRRRPGGARAGDHGEAVRDRPRERPRAQPQAARGLRRGAGLPHRPLPRQGGGPEHPRAALRQRAVRADLEPQPHRPRADRRPRDARGRHPRRLLRADRRLPRHGRHPPDADARLRRDGAADGARPGGDHRGEEQGLPLAAPDRRRPRGPRPVRGLPRDPGVDPDSDTETFIALRCRGRQLALVGRAVLPAHRKAHGRGGADHLDRLPRAAAEHVPGGLGGRRLRPRPPHLRPRRVLAPLAVLLRQAAGAGDDAREAEHAVLAASRSTTPATLSRPTSG